MLFVSQNEIFDSDYIVNIQFLPTKEYLHRMQQENISIRFLQEFHIEIVENRPIKYSFGNWWISGHLFKRLIELDPNNLYLHIRYAKALSYLKHTTDADRVYDKCMKLNAEYYWVYHSLAYHYFKSGRFEEAEKFFVRAIEMATDDENKRILYCGFAQCLDRMNETERAEGYYQLSVAMSMALENCEENAGNYYEPAHYYYAAFLRRQQRWSEAKTQFEIILQQSPCYAPTRYRYAEVLYQLKDFDGYEYHLNKCLEIDPHFPLARQSWRRYYNQEYTQDVFYNGHYENDELDKAIMNETPGGDEDKIVKLDHEYGGENQMQNINSYAPSIVNSVAYQELDDGNDLDEKYQENLSIVEEDKCYQRSFDNFWFDVIGITTAIFNLYYDRFVKYKMNDIRCILFDKQLERNLTDKIGIEQQKDMKIIMEKTKLIKSKYEELRCYLRKLEIEELKVDLMKFGIIDLDTMKEMIQSKEDLLQIVNPINLSQHAKVKRLWNAIDQNLRE